MDALMVWGDRIDAALLDAAPKLRAVCNMMVGYNNLDIAACTERGVLATNTPGVLDDTTADMAWALLLAAARRVTESERWLRAGRRLSGPPASLGRTRLDLHRLAMYAVAAARIDANGYVTIVGRSKDLIITGGYNVYPKEIESYLDDMPGVAESAVIGVPHRDFGEAVTAVVVRKPGADLKEVDIIASLKTQIAAFKVPKRVHVVDELPRNAGGKVLKPDLVKRLAQL
jgi:acyl-CoA synthetase (AMP-forming)/AMP-acid ligase II